MSLLPKSANGQGRDFEALFAAMRGACDPRRKKYLATYFATGIGKRQSDAFFPGLTAVSARAVAVRFADRFSSPALRPLLASPVYEHRFVALEMLVRKYETGGPAERARIASFYLRNLRYVDHWVLVDTSAPYLLGDHLLTRPRGLLFELASSREVARRRTAIVATWAFIRAHDFADTLRIAERLLHDDHELVHRAVGWMLREVGKRSRAVAERFLEEHHRVMPRLMLRYAVEGLPEGRRKRYLKALRYAPRSAAATRHGTR
jgi:3-methyladenine DNA glycosylase AlkD